MVDYLQEINNGLIIEDPKILLPWSLKKRMFLIRLTALIL